MLKDLNFQNLLDRISSNPEISRLLIENQPQFYNPNMRKQVMRALPSILAQEIIKFVSYKFIKFTFYLKLNPYILFHLWLFLSSKIYFFMICFGLFVFC